MKKVKFNAGEIKINFTKKHKYALIFIQDQFNKEDFLSFQMSLHTNLKHAKFAFKAMKDWDINFTLILLNSDYKILEEYKK